MKSNSVQTGVASKINELFFAGINFQKADLETRSRFALSTEEVDFFYGKAKLHGFSDFIILNTCNRTEFFGSGNINHAISLYLSVKHIETEDFNKYCNILSGTNALEHVYDVASGLDSQIIGDNEILGQFRNACKLSKQNGLLSPFFERLANSITGTAKKVRTETEISKGTSSASYLAIELIKETFENNPVSILLIGLGKMGNNIAKNIKHYLPEAMLTISNRTLSKAEAIASALDYKTMPLAAIHDKVKSFDVVLTAVSNTEHYFINTDNYRAGQLLIDLSVPSAIDPEFKNIIDVSYFNIDSISHLLDKSLAKRKAYLPQVHSIIHEEIEEFNKWLNIHVNREQIQKIKSQLLNLSHLCPHLANLPEFEINKQINKSLSYLIENIHTNGAVLDEQTVINHFLERSHQHETVH